ncbi:MAG TPA: alkaline phosphatase family protein [Pyrinomonadaceae bacterium]|nr:alkaline phosphatase family protein [Pyrinomonadaceae bacterium]
MTQLNRSFRARKISAFANITLALLLTLLPFVGAWARQQPAPRRGSRGPAATSAPSDAATMPAQNRRAVTPAEQQRARPRLVLLIAVDQFRYDYLERFGDLFVAGGLRRLQREGGSWVEANYDHIPTETAPGHATMMTGAWPAETGIIGNEWFDRDAGKRVNNVQDDTARLLGGGEGERSSSPRNLLVSTVGDELRLASNGRSKVVGISVKDRAAILPTGRMANGAYWYSSAAGHFVSSTYYFNQLPEWVTRFNNTRPADKYFGARWERLLPEAEYVRRAGPDAPAWEDIGNVKDTNTFPHIITGGASAVGREFYDALNYSPFSNDLLVSFAEQALAGEALGADDDTDFLSVSFSANDIVGHRFGPYSQEVMDITLRVDRQIAALLNLVDARVGLRNTIVVFTADHGVAPIPEHAAAMNLPGGRVKVSDVLTAVRNAVKARYNRPDSKEDATADYLQTYANGNLYFNPLALRRDGVNPEEIERVAGEAALTVPGISRYFTRTQLERGAVSPADPVARRVLHGFNSKRNGDVVIIQQPFKYFVDYQIPATHGTPYSYDTHVPLIIMGGGVAPGQYSNAATPADIAPTVARLLRVQAPSNAVGRVLIEAIK